MSRADEIQIVSPHLAVWQIYEPKVKCDCTSTALRVGEELVLIDPIDLTAEAHEELEAFGRPALIVCTSGNHARAADAFRRRYRIPVAAHPAAVPELELTIDQPLAEDTLALGALEVLALPGAAVGEIALRHPAGIVTMGDALIHLPPEGFRLLPEKYCSDPKVLPDSLQKLLRWEFDVLTFAHGWPLVGSARERLAALLS